MNIHNILEQASKLRIAVVGDLIIDRYLLGDIERISPEAPVPVLNLKQTRENPGGAGNVAANLRGLGVQVSEFYGKHVPIKTRVMSGNHHVIRIDEEKENPFLMEYDDYQMGLDYGIVNKKYDIVVISDYGKGAITTDVAEKLVEQCNKFHIPVVVDSKHNLHYYTGCTVVKCNKKEWDAFSKNTVEAETPEKYLYYWNSERLVVTGGHLGMTFYDEFGMFLTKTLAIDVCDPCGAGDTVTAVLAIGVGLKPMFNSFLEVCEIANIAASEVCMHPGVQPITKELLIKRFNEVYK